MALLGTLTSKLRDWNHWFNVSLLVYVALLVNLVATWRAHFDWPAVFPIGIVSAAFHGTLLYLIARPYPAGNGPEIQLNPEP